MLVELVLVMVGCFGTTCLFGCIDSIETSFFIGEIADGFFMTVPAFSMVEFADGFFMTEPAFFMVEFADGFFMTGMLQQANPKGKQQARATGKDNRSNCEPRCIHEPIGYKAERHVS